MPKITPNLWFDTEGKGAAEFYVPVLPNSALTHISYDGDAGPGVTGKVRTVAFVLDGQDDAAIDGGPMFTSAKPSRG